MVDPRSRIFPKGKGILLCLVFGTFFHVATCRKGGANYIEKSLEESRCTCSEGRQRSSVENHCEVKVALVLCNSDNIRPRKGRRALGINFERQLNQTLVLIKSMLITLNVGNNSMGNCVQINVISDDKKNYKELHKRIFGRIGRQNWNDKFTRHLKLVYFPIQYPKGTEWMQSIFRPCATCRLFLHEFLPYDSVLYLDTDLIFLRSVTDLWSELKLFGDQKVAGQTPCLGWYNNPSVHNKVPFYGSSGLQSGIVLMNLTRMRTTSWTSKIKRIVKKYKGKFKLPDQDILNVYFSQHPEEMHLLSCDWNYRYYQCRENRYCAADEGISVLHGNNLSFTKYGYEVLFYKIFDTFQEIQLNDTFHVKELIDSLILKMEESKQIKRSRCAKFPGFEDILLRRLRNKATLLT